MDTEIACKLFDGMKGLIGGDRGEELQPREDSLANRQSFKSVGQFLLSTSILCYLR